MRNEKDADEDATAGRGSPDPPPTSDDEKTPFQRFEEFTKRVISVPKTEIDKRERAYREGRGDPDRRRPA
jgi:hypothetical protein